MYSLQGAYPREDKRKIKKEKEKNAKNACSPAQSTGLRNFVVLAQPARIGKIGTKASFTFPKVTQNIAFGYRAPHFACKIEHWDRGPYLLIRPQLLLYQLHTAISV